jgi:Zn ribbon nucleic-acid-binding protein
MITLTREEAFEIVEMIECMKLGHKYEGIAEIMSDLLRARLAQPDPKPQEAIAKWIKTNIEHRQWYICPKCSYQAPRFKDEWQGLTDEEAAKLCHAPIAVIEALLKEKNT